MKKKNDKQLEFDFMKEEEKENDICEYVKISLNSTITTTYTYNITATDNYDYSYTVYNSNCG